MTRPGMQWPVLFWGIRVSGPSEGGSPCLFGETLLWEISPVLSLLPEVRNLLCSNTALVDIHWAAGDEPIMLSNNVSVAACRLTRAETRDGSAGGIEQKFFRSGPVSD